MTGEAEGARFGPPTREVLQFLELFAVFGLAIAQPAFDLLGKNPLLFVAWNATPARTLGSVAAGLVVPPLAAYALTLLAGLVSAAARRVVHAGLIGLGVAVIVMEALKQAAELGAFALVAGGVVAGGLGALARARSRGVRTWLRVLAVAPV